MKDFYYVSHLLWYPLQTQKFYNSDLEMSISNVSTLNVFICGNLTPYFHDLIVFKSEFMLLQGAGFAKAAVRLFL